MRKSDLVLVPTRYTNRQNRALDLISQYKGCSKAYISREALTEYLDNHPELNDLDNLQKIILERNREQDSHVQ